MKNKKILAMCLASCIGISSFLLGCNAKDDVKNAADDVKNGVEDVGEGVKNGVEDAGKDVKEGTENLVDKITDNSMTYDEDDFKRELQTAGITVQEVEDTNNTKPLFSVDNDDYILTNLNNQRVSVYEYDEGDKDRLNNDIASIKSNGMNINGKNITWNTTPHLYKKGRLIVVYDGEDSGTLDTLRSLLGNPILG